VINQKVSQKLKGLHTKTKKKPLSFARKHISLRLIFSLKKSVAIFFSRCDQLLVSEPLGGSLGLHQQQFPHNGPLQFKCISFSRKHEKQGTKIT